MIHSFSFTCHFIKTKRKKKNETAKLKWVTQVTYILWTPRLNLFLSSEKVRLVKAMVYSSHVWM